MKSVWREVWQSMYQQAQAELHEQTDYPIIYCDVWGQIRNPVWIRVLNQGCEQIVDEVHS